MTVIKRTTNARSSKVGFTLLVCGTLIIAATSAQNCIVFGTYSSLPSVSYSCSFATVSFNYSAWTFTSQGGGNIRVVGAPAGSPPVLIGTLNCGDSTFTVGVTLAGACTETYSLQGKFTSDTSWNGTFSVAFSGASCGSTNCSNQTFPVSGRTNHVTGVSAAPIPFEASLDQNFPNPFNPTTQIGFSLSQASAVTLDIYNVLGQHVENLVNERLSAGSHSVHWNPRDLPSGVYCYRIQTGQMAQTKYLIFLR